jgi:hypothetical protein
LGLKNIIFTALTGVKLKIYKPSEVDWFDRYQNHGNNQRVFFFTNHLRPAMLNTEAKQQLQKVRYCFM